MSSTIDLKMLWSLLARQPRSLSHFSVRLLCVGGLIFSRLLTLRWLSLRRATYLSPSYWPLGLVEVWEQVIKAERVISRRFNHVDINHDLCISNKVPFLLILFSIRIPYVSEIKVLHHTDGSSWYYGFAQLEHIRRGWTCLSSAHQSIKRPSLSKTCKSLSFRMKRRSRKCWTSCPT